MDRRDFLRTMLGALGATALPGSMTSCAPTRLRRKATTDERVIANRSGHLAQYKLWTWLRMFELGGEFPIPTSEEVYKSNLGNIDVAMPTNGGVLQEDGHWFQQRWKIDRSWPQDLPSLAREAGQLYIPIIGNTLDGIKTVLDNPNLQVIAVEHLIELATSTRFDAPWDGVCLDLERVARGYKEKLSDFLYLLSARIREAGMSVVVSVAGRAAYEAGDGYDFAVVNEVADVVDLRCYGYRDPDPLSIAPYWWIEACIQFALNQGVQHQKLNLGLGNFSKYWPEVGHPHPVEITYDEALQLAQDVGATIEWVEENEHGSVREHYAEIDTGHLWVHDGRTFRHGLDLVEQYDLLGVANFAVGMGDDAHWQVIEEWLRSYKGTLPVLSKLTLHHGRRPDP